MEEQKLKEYDEEPVYYCSNCLSLKIINLTDNQCFCDICGNMDIESTDIDTWQEMYRKKYKHNFLEYGRRKSNYVWKSPRDE